jgi:hypothetical protein
MKLLLFILIFFIAITSTPSGILMITDPGGGILRLPLSLLKATPFKNFMVPGILLTFVGGVNLVALYYNIRQHPKRYSWAITGGALITGWILAQLILIQAFYTLHIFYLVIGIFIILISYQLKGKWAV